MDKILDGLNDPMDKKVKAHEKELLRVRTGKASISLLDSVRVNYYGTMTPLNQVATLSTPDARTVLVSPFEKKLLSEIEKAIHVADVGVQPNNDGNVIRLPVPPLTEDRRKEIAKSIRKLGEDTKVALRKVRQDFNTKVKAAEKNKEVAEDASKTLQKDIQTVTDKFILMTDEKLAKKEKEVMTL